MPPKVRVPGALRPLARRVYPVVRSVYDTVLDRWDWVTGNRDPLVPPRKLWFFGGYDFKEGGEEFLTYFLDLGGLTPDSRVLDVGSGVGRMAVPLTRYLSSGGEYWGIELMPPAVQWCQQRISSRYPNFHFVQADLYNQMYNPEGKYRAAEYRFPFEDRAFDFVFLTSVFTHMFREDVKNYVAEIARVLRPGGRSLSTFFLLNSESEALIEAGRSSQDFRSRRDGYRIVREDIPESAVAFDEAWVRQLYASAGLRLREPVLYGSWCGRERFTSYQDILVVEKP